MVKKIIVVISIFGTLFSQDNFIGDVFENGSVNYGDRTIQAIGIGFIPENVIMIFKRLLFNTCNILVSENAEKLNKCI